MARQKSTFSVPLQTDILSGGNVGLKFANGPLPVGDLKTGYLKRSQHYELAVLRPFMAIFPQTTLRTLTKIKF